ncbi:cyclic GMP-AMP synthase-like receptor [Achroia grisella]|uniref:cyclic GMP-AMP synthase-like receptor n=1 Tax=Achroia grisella TaxID=688607 RepID=UPI0027D2FFD8|nr:cyclic GMP-AMP synthase-like receptor [Achroia grisella]XP_059061406.1 cyclic GMP-AMP synthase-like receptor [Achroia grisella]
MTSDEMHLSKTCNDFDFNDSVPLQQHTARVGQTLTSSVEISYYNLYDGDTLSDVDKRGVPSSNIPENPTINNLDTLVEDIYVRHTAFKAKDFELYYKVFDNIISSIHKNMKAVDPYFERYSSTIQATGSHSDRVRINKPDEFDMDVIIKLPFNKNEDPLDPSNSDIILEPSCNGFVQIKMGRQCQRILELDECNKTIIKWTDADHYILQNKFKDWFKGVLHKALNKFNNHGNYKYVTIDGIQYIIRTSESGPAITLKISNDNKFKLDVDLVPALQFPEERWPINSDYRDIPAGCSVQIGWMVVPKPSKCGNISRSWRLALCNQEKKLIYNTCNLRKTLQLLKKLRDAQKMNEVIMSYYIKTLFFWEIVQQKSNETFWDQPVSKLFIIMVKKFQQALANGNIPYFWNENHNLIDSVAPNVLTDYANRLSELLIILDNPTDYKIVAKYLLTNDEYDKYKSILLDYHETILFNKYGELIN